MKGGGSQTLQVLVGLKGRCLKRRPCAAGKCLLQFVLLVRDARPTLTSRILWQNVRDANVGKGIARAARLVFRRGFAPPIGGLWSIESDTLIASVAFG